MAASEQGIPKADLIRRRVLWLSHLLPWPPKGGLQQRSYYLMREVGRRHDLQVIAFRQHAHQPDTQRQNEAVAAISEFAKVRVVVDLPEDRMVGGRLHLALRSLLPGLPYTIRWGTCDDYANAVRSALHDFQPEVVHFDTISLAPYVECLNEVPAVLNHHNIESQMLLRRAEQEPNPARRFYFWQEGRRLADYERRVAKKFRYHLVCAELDAERLVETVGTVPTHVVPNGVDLDYFRPAPLTLDPEPASLVFVGGLSWYPNVSAIRFFLKKAWPHLIARYPGLRLRIIGRNPPKELLALSKTQSTVEFLGFVDDIRPIVHRSAVYICPIFDGGGTKLKMLDAMAMGKAIVAHPVACEGLAVVNENQVLQASSGEDFVIQITRLFDETTLRSRLGKSARAHVEQYFSFASIGSDLCHLYGQLR